MGSDRLDQDYRFRLFAAIAAAAALVCAGCSGNGQATGRPTTISFETSSTTQPDSFRTNTSTSLEGVTTTATDEMIEPFEETVARVSELSGVLDARCGDGLLVVTMAEDSTLEELTEASRTVKALAADADLGSYLRRSRVSSVDLDRVFAALPSVALAPGEIITGGYSFYCDCIRIGTNVNLEGVIETWGVDRDLIIVVPSTGSRLG